MFISSSTFTDQSVKGSDERPDSSAWEDEVWKNKCFLKQLGEVTPKIFDVFHSLIWHLFIMIGHVAFEKEHEDINP